LDEAVKPVPDSRLKSARDASKDVDELLGLRPGQSLELLKALHILTRDGKINQDSRRKLKQVNHLVQFIEPLLQALLAEQGALSLVDHGAGKSYLGFILYDLFFKALPAAPGACVWGIETRAELVQRSQALAVQLGFAGMRFLNLSVAEAMQSALLPAQVDVVTALHACDTATDDAIRFALARRARHIVLVPCCQAELAAELRKQKARSPNLLANEDASMTSPALTELWRHPLHTREFGSHLTNVLRCLQLEAHGYQVTVTELVGWEHSMKNELIIATDRKLPGRRAAQHLTGLLAQIGLPQMAQRYFLPQVAD
jgi:hypothetical protein